MPRSRELVLNGLRGAISHLSRGNTASYHAVTVVNKAPHPNAAKVFINWFLSRRDQLVYQESHGDRDSLRVDIPKDKVPAGMRRVAGRNYFFVEGPEFIDVKPALKIVEDALAEKARPQ